MKVKHLIIPLVLLNFSCTTTKKNIAGVYRIKDSRFNILVLNADSTFQYAYFDQVNFLIKNPPIDSCHFLTKGKWNLIGNKLVLNSFNIYFTDTARVRNVLKTPKKGNESNFSFKDIYGNTIYFNQVDDKKGVFALIIDNQYSNLNIDLLQHNTLTFHLLDYKPLPFKTIDNIVANYTIILAPFYKQGYFIDEKFIIKGNNLIKNNKVTFKKGN